MPEANAPAIFGNKDTLPAHLANAGAIGNENVDADDMQMPRLNLLQALSPQVEEIDAAKPGMIHNSVTDELFKEVYVVNVFYKKEFTIFKRRGLGNEFLGNHETEALAQAHLAAEKPGSEGDYDITPTGRHALIVMDMEGNIMGPAEMLCSGSKIYFSRKWNTEINTRCADGPRYSAVFKLSSVKQKNDKGSWFNFDTEFVGFAPEAIADTAKALYEGITKA
jgi:hypothetical protein